MHEHAHHSAGRKHLLIALAVTIAFFVIELIGGFVANSLALLADAGHMFNDALALTFAVVAAWIAEKPKDFKKTYGYYRAEILAAFLNGIFLWIVVALIFYNALGRLTNPSPVASSEMLIIAVLGLIANGVSALVLSRSKSDSLNVRGAFLHVISDTLGSIGVIAAAAIILLTGWYQADAVFSMLVGILIFYGAFNLIRESMNVLLEGVPKGIDISAVERRIREHKGVLEVHDLHVWCITPTRICALSCHIVVGEGADRRKLTSDLISMLDTEFGIDHTTIQLEDSNYPKANREH